MVFVVLYLFYFCVYERSRRKRRDKGERVREKMTPLINEVGQGESRLSPTLP
jgi:uncharacterized membrane protein YsdA (DUF1294 family)